MGAFLDFIGGAAKYQLQKNDEAAKAKEDEERETRLYEKKLRLAAAIEADAAKRKPVGTRLDGTNIVTVNAMGEPLYSRPATEDELMGAKATRAEREASLIKNDPARVRSALDLDERGKKQDITYKGALAGQAGASAREANARTAQQELETSTVREALKNNPQGALGLMLGKSSGANPKFDGTAAATAQKLGQLQTLALSDQMSNEDRKAILEVYQMPEGPEKAKQINRLYGVYKDKLETQF